MKKKILLAHLILILLISALNITFASQTKDIELTEISEVDSENAYIMGSFFKGLFAPFVNLRIEDMNTHQGYIINFSVIKNLKTYQIPPGKYKIESFWVLISKFPEAGTLNEKLKLMANVKLKLKDDERLYEFFEINPGDILYLGAYKTLRPINTDPRTTKITRENNFSEITNDMENLDLDSFNLKNLSETTVPYEPVTFTKKNGSYQDSYIAGRFHTSRFLSRKIEIVNLWNKEKKEINFSKKSDVRLFPIQPGEYIIQIAVKGYEPHILLPDSWLLPFLVKPGEVLYLGNFLLNEELTSLSSSTISKFFLNDFQGSIEDITSLLENPNDYKIRGIEETENQ